MSNEEKSFSKISINCEKPIYINFHKTIDNTVFLNRDFYIFN